MSINCSCDYDCPEFYVAEHRRARTAHRCDECQRSIEPGERYEHVRGKWDGQVGSFDTCTRCLALREWVAAHVPCFCWAHGNLLDDAIETARAYADQAPGLLFGAYRRELAIRNRPNHVP
jgi:hypothetical protein